LFRESNTAVTNLDDLALFVAIVDRGSLSAAARAQGLPKSSVTRRLAGLEARLDSRLLERSTRHLALTGDGRRLYDRLKPIIAAARDAEADLLAEPNGPSGLLRITATGAYGRQFIAPLLGTYLQRHLTVTAELFLLDRPVNLIEEGFDVAIRMGPLKETGLKRRKLADIERVLCATPDHLTSAPQIRDIDDLKRVEGLVTVEGNHWAFEVGGRTLTVTPRRRMASNHLEALHAAVLCGCGVTVLPDFLVRGDLAAGRLVRLLPELTLLPGAAHALWPSSRNMPARTRAFIDFVADRLRAGHEEISPG
jgi:DNA-binding transcriptional LysR family regulator